jgi:phosphoribosyl 1,2-cyclic phosphodiesterase
MQNIFKVKFRGVRGSIPVPGKNTVKYGGNTTCLEIRAGEHLVIIDAGTGIINLGNEMMGNFMKQDEKSRLENPMKAVMLFTHTHLDHVIGLPFFTPVFIGSSRLYMFGGMYYDRDFKHSLSQSMHSPLFPVEFDKLPSMREVKNIKEGEVILLRKGEEKPEVQNVFRPETDFPDDALKIYVHQSYAHPCNGVLVYRFEYMGKKLVFATDVEGYKSPDTRLIKFSKDADILIHDAQYTDTQYSMCQGFGHSTIDMALDVGKIANVKRLYLFHHDPRHTDTKLDEIQEYAKSILPNTYLAMEDDEIDLLSL